MTEEMDEQLIDFALVFTEMHYVREGFTSYKQNWYAWNYWAQHQQKEFSFSRWMAENNVEFEDVSGSKTNYPKVKILRNKEEGYRYYSAWRGAQKAKTDAEKKFDEIFENLWEATTPSGKPKYSNEQLGVAIGKTGEELRRYATKRVWYLPRTRRKGTTN